MDTGIFTTRIALALVLGVLFIAGTAAAEAPGQLATVRSGTVSGDLHVEAHQPVPWGSQPASGVASRDFDGAFSLPAGATGSNVAWARLYVSVYAGSGSSDWPMKTTVTFDGNGDGTYETALGTELMEGIGYSTDGTIHVLNDHCNRVYSDYLAWYDVTGAIASTTPAAHVRTEPIGAVSFDGRLKALALVVAYNDGDGDQVRYWVNQGHAWVNAASAPTTTAFGTSSVPAGFTSATLSTLALSSRDGTYTFNGQALPGEDPVAPVNFFEENAWNVTSSVTAGAESTLSMGLGTGSSFKAVLAALAVRSPASSSPDLRIASIAPNPGAGAVFFANEPNIVAVNVTNSGTGAAGASTLLVDAGGTAFTAAVGPLAAGVSTTVNVTDTVGRTGGANVTVTATADSTGVVAESDEANNTLAADLTVYNNGYKGKRWTGGEDLVTRASFNGTYDVVYSAGNSAYRAAKWMLATVTWTAGDLPVPAGATIASARLYQPYSYNKMPADPAFQVSFNGATVAPVATYSDRKGFGSYDYPYGVYVYDVTGLFGTTGNSMVLTPEGTAGTTNDYALCGAYFVVTYSDPSAAPKQVFINDGFDMLQSQAQDSVTTDEATVYAAFAGVDTAGMTGARAIAVLASAGDSGKSAFFFNGNEYAGFWPDYRTGPQVGFSSYDVTAALTGGANEARLQSVDPGTKGDNMYALTSILIVERAGSTPVGIVPGGAGLPTDTDDDGKYDDVNGNGRKDFADVVLYFNQMAWIAGNEPVSLFDYNGNGRIDFADVVWLFNNL